MKTENTPVRYAVYNKYLGIFLGVSKTGKPHWSKRESEGKNLAVTFENKDKANHYMRDCTIEYEVVPVAARKGRYATISDCVKAGLPAWFYDGNKYPTEKDTIH